MRNAFTANPLLVQVLSLYLLLLAFFVVLNTISSTEAARVKAVGGSLDATFAAKGKRSNLPVPFVAAESGPVLNQAAIERLGELVKTDIELATADVTKPGERSVVSFPSSSLFRDDGFAISPLHRRMLEKIAALVAKPAAGFGYDLDVVIGVGRDEQMAAARVAFLAAVLAEAGAPGTSLSAGLSATRDSTVRFEFSVRDAGAKRQFLTAEAEQ